MELGFYIGLGLWLMALAHLWWAMSRSTKLDPLKLLVGSLVYIGLPTFWGGVIEWALT